MHCDAITVAEKVPVAFHSQVSHHEHLVEEVDNSLPSVSRPALMPANQAQLSEGFVYHFNVP